MNQKSLGIHLASDQLRRPLGNPFIARNISVLLKASEMKPSLEKTEAPGQEQKVQSFIQSPDPTSFIAGNSHLKEQDHHHLIEKQVRYYQRFIYLYQIDVIIEFPESKDQELFKNLKVKYDRGQGTIVLRSVLEQIQELGFPIQRNLLYSYYNSLEKSYEFIGNLERANAFQISDNCHDPSRLQLKVRSPLSKSKAQDLPSINPITETLESNISRVQGFGSLGSSISTIEATFNQVQDKRAQMNDKFQSSLDSIFKSDPTQIEDQQIVPSLRAKDLKQEKYENQVEEISLEGLQEPWVGDETYRRAKERKIDFVIEKVKLWRKLYNGISDQNGFLTRYNLEEAAQKTGLSKKSLDDYLLQIRFGKRYGFDFQKHRNDSIGVLRQYVKKQKEIEKITSKKNALKPQSSLVSNQGKYKSDQILDEDYFSFQDNDLASVIQKKPQRNAK